MATTPFLHTACTESVSLDELFAETWPCYIHSDHPFMPSLSGKHLGNKAGTTDMELMLMSSPFPQGNIIRATRKDSSTHFISTM